MVPEFVSELAAASGTNFGGGLGEREAERSLPQLAAGSARPEFSGEARKTADFGRFNLWRPTVVARTGGSKWQSGLPTGVHKLFMNCLTLRGRNVV